MTATLGEVAAARCEDCRLRLSKENIYRSDVTGWHAGDDGERHNHLRGRASAGGVVLHTEDPSWMRAYRALESLDATIQATRPAPGPALTPQEIAIGAQMGVSLEDLKRTKAKDAQTAVTMSQVGATERELAAAFGYGDDVAAYRAAYPKGD